MANGTGAVYVDFGMVKIDGYRLPMQVACGVSGGNAQIISAKGSLPFALKYPTGYEQKLSGALSHVILDAVMSRGDNGGGWYYNGTLTISTVGRVQTELGLTHSF